LINSNKGLNRLVSHLHCRHAFGRCLLSWLSWFTLPRMMPG
jgi:hypothetical protein